MLSSLFLHPGFMIAGGLLVSVPIIIHLINRMRYKRIRWAAMEFLLKSQKRNRRRLIIEQLILLALRCFLIALTGFLVARYVGNVLGGKIGAQTAEHVVVIDDTLSARDHWKDDKTGEDVDCMSVARNQTLRIAKMAAQANAAQEFSVYLLSDLDKPLFTGRLSSETLLELEGKLKEIEASYLHIRPAKAFQFAREALSQSKQGQQIFHFVSDFREVDWNGADEELNKELENFASSKYNVYLIDTAHPFRSDSQPVAPQHDNVAILDLQPDTRVISSQGTLVEFKLSIRNFSTSELKNVFLNVYVDGVPNNLATRPIGSIPPDKVFEHIFQLGFDKEGYRLVSARIEADGVTGLVDDNVCHAMVKVEKEVKVLLIDGAYPDHLKPNGDTEPVEQVLKALKGYKVVVKGVDELEKANLNDYPSIFLLNVASFKEKSLKNLETYVQTGGRIAMFLGDRVQGAYYNKYLYNDGKGLFPIPLEGKPTVKLTDAERDEQNSNGLFKLFLRNEKHKVTEGLFIKIDLLRWLLIDQYYPAQPRSRWAHKAGEGVVEELATLPSRRPLEDYKSSAQELLKRLPMEDDEYEKYKPGLKSHIDDIKKALIGGYVHHLANELDRLLNDAGDPNNPKRPSLVEFFALPTQEALGKDFKQLQSAVQFGDPLILTKKFGKGQTVVCLTTAGKGWNNWSGGFFAAFTFPILITDLQKYLTARGDDQIYTVGTPVTDLVFDNARYKPEMERTYEVGVPVKEKSGEDAAKPNRANEPIRQLGTITGKEITFNFSDTGKPGLYRVTLHPRGEGVKDSDVEERAYVFNVDARAESDLRRANKEKLERNVGKAGPEQGKVVLKGPDSSLDDLRQRQSDLSESPWLYLVFLVLLICEQALAVHLSFHLKGNETQLPQGVVQAQSAAA